VGGSQKSKRKQKGPTALGGHENKSAELRRYARRISPMPTACAVRREPFKTAHETKCFQVGFGSTLEGLIGSAEMVNAESRVKKTQNSLTI
jgi:hypothetical protein